MQLQAVLALAGDTPGCLGPVWAGVLLHGAVGYGLQVELHREDVSAFNGCTGGKEAVSLLV